MCKLFGKNKNMTLKEIGDLAVELGLDDMYGDSPESLRSDCLDGITMTEAMEQIVEGHKRLESLMSKYLGRKVKREEVLDIDFKKEGLEDPQLMNL